MHINIFMCVVVMDKKCIVTHTQTTDISAMQGVWVWAPSRGELCRREGYAEDSEKRSFPQEDTPFDVDHRSRGEGCPLLEEWEAVSRSRI